MRLKMRIKQISVKNKVNYIYIYVYNWDGFSLNHSDTGSSLTGTSSSGGGAGGGSGGREPKCFSNFSRCVRFMMLWISSSAATKKKHLNNLLTISLQSGHKVRITGSPTHVWTSRFKKPDNPQTLEMIQVQTEKTFLCVRRDREVKRVRLLPDCQEVCDGLGECFPTMHQRQAVGWALWLHRGNESPGQLIIDVFCLPPLE